MSSRDLVAFSSISTVARSIALPVLFNEVTITTESQLFALSCLDPWFINRIKSVSYTHLDVVVLH